MRRNADSGHRGPPELSSARTLRTSRTPRSRLLVVAAGFVGLFACLLVFGALAEDVHEQEASALDAIATPLLHSLSSPGLDALMNAITTLGSIPVVVPLVAVALGLLLWRRRRREALFLAVSTAGGAALNESLKLIFHRPRPQLAWAAVQPDYSFPSGHAMESLVIYVALALIVGVIWGRRAGIVAVVVAVVLALLIGTSRIYLGYHYLTDVVAGFFAGAAWLLIVLAALDGIPWLRDPGQRSPAS
jgi:membrane-associated phospholipid phosphatase